jgi:hypothetical protein
MGRPRKIKISDDEFPLNKCEQCHCTMRNRTPADGLLQINIHHLHCTRCQRLMTKLEQLKQSICDLEWELFNNKEGVRIY